MYAMRRDFITLVVVFVEVDFDGDFLGDELFLDLLEEKASSLGIDSPAISAEKYGMFGMTVDTS